MILYRNRLILGILEKVVSVAATVIYKILSIFHLQLTFIVAILGIILYFTGALEASSTLALVYKLILIFSVVYAIISTLRGFLGLNNNVKKSKGAQIVKTDKVNKEAEEKQAEPEQKQKPVYFRVKQHPEYVMAEYSDRYELFRVTDGGLKKIRVDYK